MITKKLFFASIFGILAVEAASVWAKSQTITVDASVVESRTQPDRGSLHVFAIEVPNDVYGKRLDMVVLEFQVDVTLSESEYPDMTPAIAAYPLVERLLPAGAPVLSKSYASARNVRAGDAQTILVDITDIVRAWIAKPSSNYGLVVGSFTGPKLGKLDLKRDAVGSGKVARLTFFYQNRFGEPVSSNGQ